MLALLCVKNLFISWLMFPLISFLKLAQYSSTHGHPLKLFYHDSRINVRAYFFQFVLSHCGIVCLLLWYKTRIYLRLRLGCDLLIYRMHHWASFRLSLGLSF